MKLKPVIIEWEDAAVVGRMSTENIANFKPFIMHSIGFELSRNKHRILLGTIVPQDQEDASVVCIPRGMIRKIRRVHAISRRGNELSNRKSGRRKGSGNKARSTRVYSSR